MKLTKKIITVIFTLLIFIGGFIITHSNPLMSLRTYIFISGHPIVAFKGNIKTNEFQYNLDKDILDKENAMIYTIEGYNIYDRATDHVKVNYKVKKTGFLYFTEGYGEL